MRRLALVFASFAVAGAVEAQDRSAAVLRVAMDTRSPPWSFVPGVDYSREDPTKDPAVSEAQLQKAEGIDVEVARAIGRRAGMTVRIVPVAWFDLEKALVEKRVDAIVNAWTPSRQTPASIVATEPYYPWGLLVAVPAADTVVQSYEDLAGKRVGCFQTVVVDLTIGSVKAGDLRIYDQQERLFEDLKAGKLDAVVYDSPYVRWRSMNESWLRTVGKPLNRLGYHVGVRKDDTALLAKLQAAVKDIVSSGEGERIRVKWEEKKRS
jgi:polar amino acid transport system substrate-binding protein